MLGFPCTCSRLIVKLSTLRMLGAGRLIRAAHSNSRPSNPRVKLSTLNPWMQECWAPHAACANPRAPPPPPRPPPPHQPHQPFIPTSLPTPCSPYDARHRIQLNPHPPGAGMLGAACRMRESARAAAAPSSSSSAPSTASTTPGGVPLPLGGPTHPPTGGSGDGKFPGGYTFSPQGDAYLPVTSMYMPSVQTSGFHPQHSVPLGLSAAPGAVQWPQEGLVGMPGQGGAWGYGGNPPVLPAAAPYGIPGGYAPTYALSPVSG